MLTVLISPHHQTVTQLDERMIQVPPRIVKQAKVKGRVCEDGGEHLTEFDVTML